MNKRRWLARTAVCTLLFVLFVPQFSICCFAAADKVQVEFDIPDNFISYDAAVKSLKEQDLYEYYNEKLNVNTQPEGNYEKEHSVAEFTIDDGNSDILYSYTVTTNQNQKDIYTNIEPQLIGTHEVTYEYAPELNYKEDVYTDSSYSEYYDIFLEKEGSEEANYTDGYGYTYTEIEIDGADSAILTEYGSTDEETDTAHYQYSKKYRLIVRDEKLLEATGCNLIISYGYDVSVLFSRPEYIVTAQDQQEFDSLTKAAHTIFMEYVSHCEGNIPTASDLSNITITLSEGTENAANIDVSTFASTTTGETGVSIPAAVVVGALSIATALGAAGVAGATGMAGAVAGAGGLTSGKAGSEGENEKLQSTYKMYIQKDFGDCIKYDTEQLQLNARMAEVKTNGTEVDRPDLTANIDIFSDGNIIVEGCAMVGNYKAALVSCTSKGNQNPTQGVVSFRFTSAGGTFQNNVTFRLVGEPYLVYNASTTKAPELDFIYGAGGKYDLQIAACDFVRPPDEVTVDVFDEPIGAEVEKLDDFNYLIHFVNHTTLSQDTQIKAYSVYPVITVKNIDEPIEDKVEINLLPEGLTLRNVIDSDMVDDRFRVICYAELTAAETKEIMHTSFNLGLAVSKTDEAGNTVVDKPRLFSLPMKFGEMTADEEKIVNLAKNIQPTYEKGTDSEDRATYYLSPKQQIPQEEGVNYDAVLPVSCEYKGQNYSLDIPVRLLGEVMSPKAQKDEEFKKLRMRIMKYVPEDQWGTLLDDIKVGYDAMSVNDLQLMSKSIIKAAIRQYESDAASQMMWADILDWTVWGLEWVEWTGDQAFSLLIAKLSGPYAPLVDSILSPAKSIFCKELGQAISDYMRTGDYSMFSAKSSEYEEIGISMIENMLTNNIDSKTSPKKAGALLVCFCMTKFCRYMYYGKDDKEMGIYDSIMATFGDLTGQAFKFAGGQYFEKFVKDPKNKNAIVTKLNNWLHSKMATFDPSGSKLSGLFDKEDQVDASAVIGKYLEEMISMFGGYIYGKTGTSKFTATTISIPFEFDYPTEYGTIKVKNTVCIDPLGSMRELAIFLYDSLLSDFTYMTSAVAKPSDPPLIENTNKTEMKSGMTLRSLYDA